LLIARGLLAPETGYLESASPEALAKLREDLEGVRNEIRIARTDLREALRRGEHAAVSLFAAKLSHTVDTAEARIADRAIKRKSRRAKVLLAATGTVALTAASTLFPLVGLPFFAGAATVAGLAGLFWGDSLPNAWKEMRTSKRDICALSKSPLHLLASYAGKTTANRKSPAKTR
jgi:hypothetical protein